MKKIIIAVDFSEQTGKVMDIGLSLAKDGDAEVILLHTEPPATGYVYNNALGPYGGLAGFGVDAAIASEIISQQLTNDQEALDLLKEKAERLEIKVTTENFVGDTVATIIEECKKHQPDMLVIGFHKQGFFSGLFSEKTELTLVKNAPCPVLLVPDDLV